MNSEIIQLLRIADLAKLRAQLEKQDAAFLAQLRNLLLKCKR